MLIDPTTFILEDALSISDTDYITGWGFHGDTGVYRACLLTPNADTVPVPAAVGILALGLVGLVRFRRLRTA